MVESSQWIRLLKRGDKGALEEVYTRYRTAFIRFAKRYGIDSEEAVDVYQDATIIFYENAVKGKLDDLRSSVKTYLFSIGKYLILNRLKKSTQEIPLEDMALPEILVEEIADDDSLRKLGEGLGKLGERCRQVLEMFYYEGKKLDEIQEILGYGTKDVLKSQKSRCLKQLRDLLND